MLPLRQGKNEVFLRLSDIRFREEGNRSVVYPRGNGCGQAQIGTLSTADQIAQIPHVGCGQIPAAAGGIPVQNHEGTAQNRIVKRGKRGARRTRFSGTFPQHSQSLGIQILRIGPKKRAHMSHRFLGGGRDPAQGRHDLPADVVSGIGVVRIGAVHRERNILLPAEQPDLLGRTFQQRTDIPSPQSGDAAHTGRAGTAEHMKQYRFQIIVGRVSGGYKSAVLPGNQLVKNPVADAACRLLDSYGPLFGQRRHVGTADHERDAPSLAKIPAKRRIPIGLRPADAVMDVDSRNGNMHPGPVLLHQSEKGGRIGTAGIGHVHRRHRCAPGHSKQILHRAEKRFPHTAGFAHILTSP